MKEKERKQKHRRRKRHDFDQTDNESDLDRNLSQLVLQALSYMKSSLAMTHSLTAVKHFHGSDAKFCRKWLKNVNKYETSRTKQVAVAYETADGSVLDAIEKAISECSN